MLGLRGFRTLFLDRGKKCLRNPAANQDRGRKLLKSVVGYISGDCDNKHFEVNLQL